MRCHGSQRRGLPFFSRSRKPNANACVHTPLHPALPSLHWDASTQKRRGRRTHFVLATRAFSGDGRSQSLRFPLETRNLPLAKGVYSPHWGEPSVSSPLYTNTTDGTNTLTLMHKSRDGGSKLAGTPSASCWKSNTIATVVLMLQRRPLLARRRGWKMCTTRAYPEFTIQD